MLHDLFAVPFEEIAPIVGRTPTAARQPASQARRRVPGATTLIVAIEILGDPAGVASVVLSDGEV